MFARAFSSAVQFSARRLTSPQMARWSPPPAPWSRSLSTTSNVLKDRHDSANASTPTGSCFIANIPYNVTAEQLKDAFVQFGKVRTVKLLTSEAGLSRGLGFVDFESAAEAVNFVDASAEDPIFILDRQLHVRHAHRSMKSNTEPCDTLVISHPGDVQEGTIREMFGDYGDSIMAVRYPRRQEGAVGRAFVQFHSVDTATEAMDALRNQNGGIQVSYAKQRQNPATPYRSLASRLSQRP